MSKNRGNPDLERPGGLHDAVMRQEAQIAAQRQRTQTTTTTTTGASR